MEFHTTYLSIVIFTIFSFDFKGVKAENGALDFIEMLRQKVRNLEATGQIKRDYEPYAGPKIKDNETYDFIIVGAGSAGSAIVHRLSEVSDWKILLLEAGGEPDIINDIPIWSPMLHFTDLNWKFYTEKEENFGLGLENQRMYWPRGKGLGGTSLLNYMVFTRGAKEDYDKWAALGNPGWSYRDVLPYFKKLETCKILEKDEDYRGQDGPIHVEDAHRTEAGRAFVEAAQNSGYEYVDFNGGKTKGVSYAQGTLKRGLRCSGERCYIKPVRHRRNLTISPNSHVTKILIKDRTAYGVEFIKNRKTHTVLAQKEVILSAGAINSPHLLLLSGVGPRRQLLKFEIEPIVDLPVGQKMYDHPSYWGLGFTVNESIIYDPQAALEDDAFKQLFNEGKGILRSISMVEGMLFAKTPYALKGDVADIEIVFDSAHISQDEEKGIGALMGLSKVMYENMYKKYENQTAACCIVALMHPESYGRIELQSSDPLVYPKIYSGYFTDPQGRDVKTLTAGIREAIRVILSPPFDKYGIKLMDEPVFGCEHLTYDSDEYWECAIRHLSNTIYHHTTTCKMGPADDPESVVDNRLRVYGVRNLRVADTSIIPVTLTGHTNVPAFLVGEKLADMIKEEYLY